ncbi:aspartate aminotransferase family protein [Gordonia sp. TBRC 11910]|uniref:Aspartate aminotransferase family protein n=1 Tax=Gordonia asplenii TaxID=2725283 RepID=A0A848KZL1_9ACTN|nr:aspartate aminotransferase family protein [Gordonia asplenii]NMO00888.1 aspartate aminotransferase family protein [Gordonia asplenii]
MTGQPRAVGADALWHPFAPMQRVRHRKLTISRADDVWVWDSTGRKYLDATAGLWYCNVGHGRHEIIDAVTNQLRKLDCYQIFNDIANEPALELAHAISSRAPVDNAKVFFTSGGSDAIDTAAKLARAYFTARGRPERTVLLHRTHSYHGTHGHGTALAGIPANRVGAPFVGDVEQVPNDDVGALEEAILAAGPDRVAAFFAEPVLGAGGVVAPPDGFLRAAAEVCHRHGILFVADSVICGFGRLGNWFGIERFGVRPDMITFAKGVTSGYQPLGGVVVGDDVAAPFWEEPNHIFRHGQTYAGHPVACAAGLANIEVLESRELLAQSLRLEIQLAERLRSLADHPLLAEVRAGVGFLGALQLAPERLAGQPELVRLVVDAIREEGVLARLMGEGIGFSPPLTATDDQLDQLTDAVCAGLDHVQTAFSHGSHNV